MNLKNIPIVSFDFSIQAIYSSCLSGIDFQCSKRNNRFWPMKQNSQIKTERNK